MNQYDVADMWPHLKEVEYEGVHWADIDWTKDIHKLKGDCPYCGSDGIEGHQNACPILFKNQLTQRGRSFLKNQIKEALDREQLARQEVHSANLQSDSQVSVEEPKSS